MQLRLSVHGGRPTSRRREKSIAGFEALNRDADLPEVVCTLCPTGRLTGGLHSWKKKCDEQPDDGDHNEQLDERQAGADFHGAG